MGFQWSTRESLPRDESVQLADILSQQTIAKDAGVQALHAAASVHKKKLI